jgi:hypothetical protein
VNFPLKITEFFRLHRLLPQETVLYHDIQSTKASLRITGYGKSNEQLIQEFLTIKIKYETIRVLLIIVRIPA